MEMKATFTVMVAVYNGSAYLRKCLDSLVNQSLRNIQIICIDDASTDGSWSIIQEYASRDKRILPLHLSENRGAAAARNEGLKYAYSQYTAFLDSDDSFSPDALEQAAAVFGKYPGTDCVLFQVMHVKNSHDKPVPYPMQPFEVISGMEAFTASLTWKIHGIYAVRTEIHQRYPYDDTCKTYSDDNTTRIHYIYSREVRTCEGVYYYLENEHSVTHVVNRSRFNYLKANESMKRQLMEMNINDELIDKYENIRWLVLIDLYMFHFNHRDTLCEADLEFGMAEIHRIWKSIEWHRLFSKYKYKFGYMPLHWSWHLFRLQEELYFTLRRFHYLKINNRSNQT